MAELTPISVAFLLFPNITQLDLAGPAQVFSRLGNCQIDLVWKNLDPVATDSGFSLLPTARLEDISHADILCIPGGLGTVAVMQDEDLLDWVRSIAKTSTWVTSVCTGSLVLAAAGLLKGYKSACHWGSIEQLTYFDAIPTYDRVVFDRNRVSGGGVTSGIDFALSLAAKIRGEEHAKGIQLAIEYDPHPPFNSGSPKTAAPETVKGYQDMIEKFVPDRDAKVKAIAKKLGF